MKSFISLCIGVLAGAVLVGAGAALVARAKPLPLPDPEPDMLARFRVAVVQCEGVCGSVMPFDFTVAKDAITCRCLRPAPIAVKPLPKTKLAEVTP